MGAPIVYNLAKRGLKVLGLDQFDVLHESGSHTGQSRIVRKSYFENANYVPLLKKAYAGWWTLEDISGENLFHNCGLLYGGLPESELIGGVQNSSDYHSVQIDQISDFDRNPLSHNSFFLRILRCSTNQMLASYCLSWPFRHL